MTDSKMQPFKVLMNGRTVFECADLGVALLGARVYQGGGTIHIWHYGTRVYIGPYSNVENVADAFWRATAKRMYESGTQGLAWAGLGDVYAQLAGRTPEDLARLLDEYAAPGKATELFWHAHDVLMSRVMGVPVVGWLVAAGIVAPIVYPQMVVM